MAMPFITLIRYFISAATIEWDTTTARLNDNKRCFLLNSLNFKVYQIVSESAYQPNMMHLVPHSLLRGILFLHFEG